MGGTFMQIHTRVGMALATALVCAAPGAASRRRAGLERNHGAHRAPRTRLPRGARGDCAAGRVRGGQRNPRRIRAVYRRIAAPDGASAEAAAVAAAHAVLRAYFPADAAALDAARAASLAGIPDGPAEADGAAGRRVGRRVRDCARDDGLAAAQFYLPGSPRRGVAADAGLSARRRHTAPLATCQAVCIARSDQFRSAPPPAAHEPKYARDSPR